MIKNILDSKHIRTSSIGDNLYISPGAQSAGMVRYNTSSNFLEVYDGVAWRQLGHTVTMALGTEAEAAIDWAVKKMQEEKLFLELAEKFPAVAEARNKMLQAQSELKVIAELVK